MFKNGVLRAPFEPKREEGTGEWRKLHNEELSTFYTSTDVISLHFKISP
jgi:hypothetical protein